MLDKVTWPVVALISVVLAAVVFLSLSNVDVDVITDVLMALGLGGVLGATAGINNKVNGNLAELLRQLRFAMEKLSQSPPIPPDDKGV